ncbi:hypothetical protein CE91St41_13540 [Oscillospiraceae bacterium]|nr:hypothetical protein CE91St40_24000 [Oscillospiraceae bacterium]BDF74465.1 hypothetical protein CE91St41_13540 [Oscillospiraceae bacterium]
MEQYLDTLCQEKKFLEYSSELPLVSVIVISYNNGRFLYHSIKSVLEQNYGNYELIISDDASVGYFIEDGARLACMAIADILWEHHEKHVEGVDRKWKKHTPEDAVERSEYIRILHEWDMKCENYTAVAQKLIHAYFPNIRRFEFRRNTENLGTVKHLKTLKQDAQGKYVMFLAADDKLHDPQVVPDMIERFESLPEDVYVLTSQCGMYDENLTELLYYAVNPHLEKIITESTPKQLFGELADWCIIPAAGTIYKKKAFEQYGDLDPRYCLIEDWTYFLKLSRSGCKIHYYDRLTYMHRDGGISHGNNSGGSLAYKHYLEDCILLTQQEILPYLDEITPNQRKRSLRRYRDTYREYSRLYEFSAMSTLGKVKFVLKYWRHYIPKFVNTLLEFFAYRAKWGLTVGMCALLLSFLLSLTPNAEMSGMVAYYIFGIFGMGLFWGALLVLFLNSLVSVYRKLKHHFAKEE